MLDVAQRLMPLAEARQLFASLGYSPALTETQTLREQHRIAAL